MVCLALTFHLTFFLLMPGLQSPGSDSKSRAKDLQAAGIADDASLLEFLRSRTLDEAGLSKLQQLVKELGDRSFVVREAASKGLVGMGKPAAPYLERAKRSPDPEVARRAEECLRRVTERDGRPGLAGLVVQQIGSRKPKEASLVLLAYLPFADNEGVAEEVLQALSAVAVVQGKPDTSLVDALSAKLPERRAAAAQALAGVQEKSTHAKVLELLKDKEASVRLRTALALVQNNDADGIPALIDILNQLSPRQILVAEDALIRVAGDGAPITSPGSDPAAVRRFQHAWEHWWAGQRKPFDLKAVSTKSTPRGFTTIVMLDAGRVLELDKQDKVRLKFEGLNYPLDVQMLPGDRLLAAEYHGDRITERDSSGSIVWEFHLEKPLMAQRLPNGHTFMANEQHFLEVNREGKEILSLRRPVGDQIMKAVKLPNGDIAFISRLHYYARVDSQGREVAGFPVNIATSGGRLDVLPNGHVLIPIKESDRVVEFDSNGRIMWQAQFNQPVAAVRLPSGNTLLTAYQEKRAVEIDPSGKEVWQYDAGLRVTRAFRR